MVRTILKEPGLLMVVLAMMMFFMTVGVLFRAPLTPDTEPVQTEPTLHQLGLDDPSSSSDEEPRTPSLLETWNNQLLIGH